MNDMSFERRRFLKRSALSFIGITTFGYTSANEKLHTVTHSPGAEPLFYRYPSMNDSMVSSVVDASHFDFAKVNQMVTQRPELAKAAWDWEFGDWETALGAASHVGRRDIAELLISYGARPDIFTFIMMGMLKSVQDIIETVPGIQSNPGPHGITLLQHAKNRLTDKNISAADSANVNKVISYLESIGNADSKPKSLEITEEEKKMYFGEYRFGDGADEILVVNLHRLGYLQLGRKGAGSRSLTKTDENTFFPAGAPSVKIIFKMKDGKAVSLSIHEPEPLVSTVRI